MTHNIPHRLETTSLMAPSTCDICQKFVWGLYREALHCRGT
jgi:hypothetical protein